MVEHSQEWNENGSFWGDDSGASVFFMLLLLIDLFDMIMNSKRNMNKQKVG